MQSLLRISSLLLVLITLALHAPPTLSADCSATTPCPTGCCSKWGFCGWGTDFCGDGCLNNCNAKKDCDENNPCKIGCCSKFGFCGLGKDYCSKENCVSGCDQKSDCDPTSDGSGAPFARHAKCPLNVCCFKYGFCGMTEEFCGTTNTPKRPSCNVGDQQINRVIGYYEAWAITRPCDAMVPQAIPAGAYTHLNFAFASINPSTFEVVPSGVGDGLLFQQIQSLKLLQPQLKIWIAIGGWAFSDADQPTTTTFSDLVGSQTNVDAFCRSLVSMMGTYGFDGVDIDWEYPEAPDRNGRGEDYTNFPRFIASVRNALGNGGRDWGLSLTLPSSFWYLQHFDIKALQPSVDWFNLMSYDLHGTGVISNKWTGPYVNSHTNLTEIKDALDLLWRNEIDPAKVNLGLAFYGRSFTLADSACMTPGCRVRSGGDVGPCSGTVGVLLNTEITRVIADNNLTPTLYREEAVKGVNWGNQWVSFDDGDTFRLKGDFAKSQCLGGVMVWAVSHDDRDGSSAYALNAALGRRVSNTGQVLADLQTDPSIVISGTCRWTNCNEGCPDGYKPVQRDGSVEAMIDSTNCDAGLHTFCCPTSVDLPICTWRGHRNDGACQPGCAPNEVEVGTLKVGCNTKHQSACCSSQAPTFPYSKCKWVGESPLCSSKGSHANCPGDYPKFVVASSDGAGGEKTCDTGAKSYCCQDYIPDQFQDCQWYSKATNVNGKPNVCESSYPSDTIRLAMHKGDCKFGKGAYCCKGKNMGGTLPATQPTNPAFLGDISFEFISLLLIFRSNPTCPADWRPWDRYPGEPPQRRQTQSELNLDQYDRLASLMSALLWAKSPPKGLTGFYDSMFADHYDPYLEYDSLVRWLDPTGIGSPQVDVFSFCEDLFCQNYRITEGMRERRQAEAVLCEIGQPEKRAELKLSGAGLNSDKHLNNGRALSGNSTIAEEQEKRNILENGAPGAFGRTPSVYTILSGILDGANGMPGGPFLSLNYARWLPYSGLSGRHAPGFILEVAYWIGPQPGVSTLDPFLNRFRDSPNDRWVVFHIHFENDLHTFRVANGNLYPGATAINVYHGQYATLRGRNNRVENSALRIPRSNGLGTSPGPNARATVINCPLQTRWYMGLENRGENDPEGVVSLQTLLHEWAVGLRQTHYIDENSFSYLYRGGTFLPSDYNNLVHEEVGNGGQIVRTFLPNLSWLGDGSTPNIPL